MFTNLSHEIRTPLNAIISMTSIGKAASSLDEKNHAIEKIEGASTHLLGIINELNRDNIRALIIDDDTEALGYFMESSEELGIICDSASCTEKAITMMNEKIWHKLYFINWKLHGINSIELTKTIKQRNPDSPVVAMVSSTEWSVIADEAKSSGVDHFLLKPFSPADIDECISFCLNTKKPRHLKKTMKTDSIPHPSADQNLPLSPDNFTGCRILLAEDVEINREIVLSLFEPYKLKIDCAENGAQALHLFSENPESYDMILMDIQMPEMDGIEATRRIRAKEAEISASLNPASHVPIIAMTASVFREDIEKCREAGMDDHIGKPLDMETVLEKMRYYLITEITEDAENTEV